MYTLYVAIGLQYLLLDILKKNEGGRKPLPILKRNENSTVPANLALDKFNTSNKELFYFAIA